MNSLWLKKNLNLLMKDRTRSLSRVSRLSRMNKSTLHGYMNGVYPKSLKGLMDLAEVLGVTPEDLLFKDLTSCKESPETASFLVGTYEVTIKFIKGKNNESL